MASRAQAKKLTSRATTRPHSSAASTFFMPTMVREREFSPK
jgi:hypothetical protein